MFALKVFALNCAYACYQIRFTMCTDDNKVCPEDMSATVFPVWQLSKDGYYYHRHNIIYMNNWYTSLPLFSLLHDWGIHLVCTIRTHKQGLPQDGIFPKTEWGQHARGEMNFCRCSPVLPAWQDTKPYYIFHTFLISTKLLQQLTVWPCRCRPPLQTTTRGW